MSDQYYVDYLRGRAFNMICRILFVTILELLFSRHVIMS